MALEKAYDEGGNEKVKELGLKYAVDQNPHSFGQRRERYSFIQSEQSGALPAIGGHDIIRCKTVYKKSRVFK